MMRFASSLRDPHGRLMGPDAWSSGSISRIPRRKHAKQVDITDADHAARVVTKLPYKETIENVTDALESEGFWELN